MRITKNRELEIVMKYLINEPLLKNALKGSDILTLERAQEVLSKICLDLKDELELKRIEDEEREQKRLDVLAMIEAQGFSLKELMGSKTKSTRARKAYRYMFNTESGKTKYWSGMGRMPLELKTLVDAGKPLESFLIEPQTESNA